MRYENIEPLGSTHILFKDNMGCRVVRLVAGLQCHESKDYGNPMLHIVGGHRVTKETFDDVISYLRER
jgi:hypothetical protein